LETEVNQETLPQMRVATDSTTMIECQHCSLLHGRLVRAKHDALLHHGQNRGSKKT